MGGLQTRLYGAQHAKGKYIIFCDADDYYLNSACFEKMFKLTKDEKYDLIQFGFYKKYHHMKRKIKSVNKQIDVDAKEFYDKDYPILLCNNYPNSHLTVTVWNKIYRKDLFDYRFDIEMSVRLFMGDDIVFDLCVVQNCKNVLFTPQIFYVYNDLTGGTAKFRINEMDDLNVVKSIQIKYLEKWRTENHNTNYYEVEQALFAEIAAWFFLFIQQLMDHMEVESIKKLIKQILGYSTFAMAKKYYSNHSKENWMAANLLRTGDVEIYIEEAQKKESKKTNLTTKIKKNLLIVYKRI